jgi:2-octaprenyl-6-methoxyphenol hydroxylase
MNGPYDIIIMGAGLVGTSLAAALKNTHFRIAILETHLPELIAGGGDARPLSLAYGSHKILDTLGLWSELGKSAEPIQAVHVSEKNRFGALHFRATEEKVPALGYVVSFDRLQDLLYQQAAQSDAVTFIPIQKLMRVQYISGKTKVSAATIHGEKTFEAELLVAADGAHSPTRELLGIAAQEQLGGMALTLSVELTRPHQSIAYERFTEQGVIAVLPLKNSLRCRVVWTIGRDFAETVAQWSDVELAQYLQAAMHDRLGEWKILERGRVFPLEMVLAREQIRPGAVLLGNSAHTIYPLAAQGFNLGLRDVAALAETLIEARKNYQALGDETVLKQYLNWRMQDQRWISGLTDGASQFFDLQIPGLGALRGAGLFAADLFPPVKHRLAKRLLGLSGKLPKLARGVAL